MKDPLENPIQQNPKQGESHGLEKAASMTKILSFFFGFLVVGAAIGTLIYSQSPQRLTGNIVKPGSMIQCDASKGLIAEGNDCVCDEDNNYVLNPKYRRKRPDPETGSLGLNDLDDPCLVTD
jgi:hypothetical protein